MAGRRSRIECRPARRPRAEGPARAGPDGRGDVGADRRRRRRRPRPASRPPGRAPRRGRGRPGGRDGGLGRTPTSGWPTGAGGRSCSSPVRPAWARRRWRPRPPGPRSTRVHACCSGTARRSWPRPISCSPRRWVTTSPTRPEDRARGPRRCPRLRAVPTRPRPRQSGPGPPAHPGHRLRLRAVPPVRGRGRPAGQVGARPQPVVVVLDDLQWADKGSLLLLRHLASSDNRSAPRPRHVPRQ